MIFDLTESNNNIIEKLSQTFDMSDSPVMGPSYIFPDGKFIIIPTPEEMGAGVFVSYKCHSLLHLWLVSERLTNKTIWDINGMTDILDAGAIKVNLGPIPDEDALLNYIELPKKKPTASQYSALIDWMDLAQSKGIYEIEVDTYNQGKYKKYSLKENTSDEVVAKIKRFYASGTLYECKYRDDLIEAYLDDEEKYWDYGTEVITDERDIISTKTTGVSFYNQFLGTSELDYLRDHKNLKGEIVKMSPNEYYDECAKTCWNGRTSAEKLKMQRKSDEETIEYLKNVVMVFKRKLCLPMLNYAEQEQEGLHRMMVVGELLGWDFKVPVLVVRFADEDRAQRDKQAKIEAEIYDDIRSGVNKALWIHYDDIHEFEEQLQWELDRSFKYNDHIKPPIQFILKENDDTYIVSVSDVEYEFEKDELQIKEQSSDDFIEDDDFTESVKQPNTMKFIFAEDAHKVCHRKTINTNESTILTEDIAAVRKNYPNISDDDFDRLIRLDPTFVEGKDSVGTYGKWILTLFNKGKLDNEGHVKDVLTRFESEKKNLKNKDIGQFKSLEDVDAYLDDDDNYKSLSHRQEVRQRQNARKNADIENEAEKVYEDSKWEVWVPKTYAASCKLGKGSSWCTATTESDYYYRYYSSQGNLYINLNKQDENDKYQFHFESSQFMDIDDRSIDLVDFLGDNEGLHSFYYPIIAKSLGIDLSQKEVSFELTESEVDDLFREYDNHANRSEVGGDFILKLLSGDAWDAFELWDYDPQINWAYLPKLSDACKKELDRLGITEQQFAEVIERKFDPDDYDEELPWFDIAEDLIFAVKIAMTVAEENGALIEAENSLSNEIENASGGGFQFWYEKGTIHMSADPTAIMRVYLVDLDGDLSQTGEPFSGDRPQALNVLAYVFCDNFSFYEPQYGWNGFDDEAFLDRLLEELMELDV